MSIVWHTWGGRGVYGLSWLSGAEGEIMGGSNEALAAIKTMVRDAWRLLMRLPDLETRFLHRLRSGWIAAVVHDARDAYGWHPNRLMATPRQITDMETVMDWMSWLLWRDGKFAVQRILAWSMGVPWREIAIREGCSRRAVIYRMNRSFAALLEEFFGQKVTVEMELDCHDNALGGIRAFAEPRGYIEPGELPEAGKVFIGGEGFRFHGKPYQAASEGGGKLHNKRH